MSHEMMTFLVKNHVKYFNLFSTILRPILNFFGTKMVSIKSSTNGKSFMDFEGIHCNDSRIPTESLNI